MEYERKVRKQIYLDPEQNRHVKQISVQNGMSEAEFIREAVDNYLASNQMKQEDPLIELVGMVKNGEKNGSMNHDLDIYVTEKGDTHEKK